VDTGDQGRFRRFTRAWIAERGDSLDISWLVILHAIVRIGLATKAHRGFAAKVHQG
jgi:hypothetical protein